jgi:cytochrome P450
MANTDIVSPGPASAEPVTEPGPQARLPEPGWIVTRHSQVREVLSNPVYEVPAAVGSGPAGTIGWLRASVCRFVNGEAHARRRALVIGELERISPLALREDAGRRAHAALDAAAEAGRLDVTTSLARRVPMAALAAALGIADAEGAACAVPVVAAAYFPGTDAGQGRAGQGRVGQGRTGRERAADLATAELARMLGPGREEVIAARIALLVQACDGTAGLIGEAIHRALAPPPDQVSAWSTQAILAEVLRHDPPVRVSRRVSREAADLCGQRVPAGSVVLLRIDSANRDPAVFDEPDCFDPARFDPGGFDPGRGALSSLTFGDGLRPCPGPAHALMLAAGVVQAVRDRCAAVAGAVERGPQLLAGVPARLEVILR